MTRTEDTGTMTTTSAVVTDVKDRVRWGPIIAGLFASLATLALLSVLGVAIGASAYDPGDLGRNFAIGAGIWSALSALIAFFVGGWVAARTAALYRAGDGAMNGAMVWVTAIPLLLFLVGGGMMRTAQTAAEAGMESAADRGSLSDAARSASAQVSGDGRSDAAATGADQPVDAQDRERVADTTARTAWGTLVSLVLGLAAASLGGYAGSRRAHRLYEEDMGRIDRDQRTHTETVRPERPISGS